MYGTGAPMHGGGPPSYGGGPGGGGYGGGPPGGGYGAHSAPGEKLFGYLQSKGKVTNGQLPWNEFGPLCQQIGWDTNTAQTLWYQTDTDRSGQLDRTEFLQFAARPDVSPYLTPLETRLCSAAVPQPGMHGGAQPPGARLFRHLDGKGCIKNNELSWTEFAPLCQQIGWDQNTAHTLWSQTDTDHSGQLSYVEFLQFAARPDVSPYLIPLEQRLCAPAAAPLAPAPAPAPKHAPAVYSQPMGQPMAYGQPAMTYGQPAMAYGQPAYGQPMMAQPVMAQPMMMGVRVAPVQHTTVVHAGGVRGGGYNQGNKGYKNKGYKTKKYKHKTGFGKIFKSIFDD